MRECREGDSLTEGQTSVADRQSSVSRFEDDLGDGLLGSVGKRERNVRCAEPCGKLSRLAVKGDRGSASGLARDLNVTPAYAMVPAGAERLHGRFLGGEAGGVAFHPVSLGIAVADFAFSENTVKKAVAMAGKACAMRGTSAMSMPVPTIMSDYVSTCVREASTARVGASVPPVRRGQFRSSVPDGRSVTVFVSARAGRTTPTLLRNSIAMAATSAINPATDGGGERDVAIG